MNRTRQEDRRVALAACPDYGLDQVQRAVDRCLDLLGGWNRFAIPAVPQ